MGIESFFVTLLPRDMEFCFRNNIRDICGKSNVFEVDWENILSISDYSICKKESCFILDDCIEIQIVDNVEGSPYIILRACFSCFSDGIKKMYLLIEFILNQVNKDFTIDVLGETHEWGKSVSNVIYEAYKEKYSAFKNAFGDIKLITPPSRFYYEYKKMKNPINRILSRILK